MSRKRRPPGAPPPRLPWDALYPTLDLHGATGDEARARTERFLRDRQAEGIRTVRVITGRGRRSVGLPVLRSEVEALLSELRGTRVASFALERAGGSFLIELRRAPAPRRAMGAPAAAPPLGEVDPELLRRAEEALAELGVHPTPELIEIELRRMTGPDREG